MKSWDSRWLNLLIVVLTLGCCVAPALADDTTKPALTADSPLGKTYIKIAGQIHQDDLQATVQALASMPSRIPGYDGYEQAANYVESQMRAAHLQDVHRESFKVAIPVDRGASLTVGGRTFKLYPLWPNQVRTSQVPPGGVTAPLIDGRDAKLTAFGGRVVKGSIVLVDFDSSTDWLNAPRQGARAVIFVEPHQMLRGEAEAKWVQLPLTIPRYYISRDQAALVRAMIRLAPQGALQGARLQCNMQWQNVQAHNLVGLIEGSDPELKRQVMVVESFYDSMSTVPSLAPGADATCGIATFLALARLYSQPQFRPKRSVLFIADGAHFEALAGIRHYINDHFNKPEFAGTAYQIAPLEGAPMWQRFRTWVGVNSLWIFVILLIVFGLGIYSSLQRVHGWGGEPGEEPRPATPGDRLALSVWSGLAALFWIVFILISPNRMFPIPCAAPQDTLQRWYAFTALDLTSRNCQVGVFYKGMFYDMREDIQRNFSDFARSIRENVENIAPLIGEDKDKNFADGVNPISGKSWRNFIPGKLALDQEPVTMAGGIGIGFVTTSDTRPYADTPSDTIDRMQMLNLASQAKLLGCIYYNIFNDSNKPDSAGDVKLPLTSPSSFGRMTLQGGFGSLYGRVVQYIPTKSFVPNTPIPGSLAILVNNNKSYAGVRGDDVQLVGQDGQFDFIGVAPLTAYGWNRDTNIQAYHLDRDGDVDFAPDQGVNGAANYPISIQMTVARKEATIVLFKCVSTSMYGLVDPQSMTLLTQLNLYDAQTDSEPQRYGVSTAHLEAWQTHVEPVAILFSEKGTAIKVVMGSGPIATRLVLINYTPVVPIFDQPGQAEVVQALKAGEDPEVLYRKYALKDHPNPNQVKVITQFELLRQWMLEHPDAPDRVFLVGSSVPQYASQIRQSWKQGDVGAWLWGPDRIWTALRDGSVKHKEDGDGYTTTNGGTLEGTAYKVATDMYWLDNFRIELLSKYRIINQGMDKLHADTGRELATAARSLRSLDYDRFDSRGRAAWGFESRAYPSVMETAQDVVKGVLFYLFLLLPFAYFCERLFFGKPDLRQQLSWGFAIFFLIFMVLYEVHPAFEISKNPVVVLLAFIMLALGLLVISLVISKFEEQLKEYQKSVGGVHKADIGRMSVALAAFSLGISNMRKRPARTTLTCFTLVLLTFTVLSFTSVVSDIHFNKIPAGEHPPYNGLLIRSPNWSELQESAYDTLNDEFGSRRSVAPRAWFYTDPTGDQSFVTIGTNKNNNTYDAKAVLGLAPQEARVTHVDRAIAFGSWFKPFDPYTAIIPEGMAKTLDLTPDDIGKAKLRFNGLELTLTGILSNSRFKDIKDLDGESIAPVDFIQMQRQQQQTGGGNQSSDQGFQQYIHLEPDQIMIVPYRVLLDLGGANLRSVAIDFVRKQDVESVLDNLMPRLDMNLYAGIGHQIYRYSSIGSTTVSGMFDLLFPILIAACIVLNTMLGSVFERIKEIHIFSSIGLAPNHVAMLFLAESFVYSILGSVLGYVLGQTITKIISHYHLLEGLSLNFSSISGVLSTILVIGVVMLSTLYPARKASQVATPAIDRTWQVPDPIGDDWNIPMPFSVTGDQAVAMRAFLTEWFKAYEEYSIGDFVTQNVRTYEFDTEHGMAFSIALMAWLAPFDLGVSQKVELQTIPTEMQDVYELRLVAHRESGDVSNWKRVNRRFLNTLRKQFLIWRTLGASEREKYLAGAVEEASV